MRNPIGRFGLALSFVLSSIACGPREEPPSSGDPAVQGDPSGEAAEGAATGEEAVPSAETEAGPTAQPSPEPVDLLGALPTELAVSSVYRDREEQIARMLDGDLESAWNSRSGDLVGGFIEVRVPNGAHVSTIEMTNGFTRAGETDLFTGNHRIARVKIQRDGEDLLEHAFDVDSREPQAIPIDGPGGVYRIEVLETVPGTRSDWRELCVSSLRVLGHGPGLAPGERFPRVAVGTLPPPRGEPAPVDAVALARTLRGALPRFLDAWSRYEDDVRHSDFSSGEPGLDRMEVADANRTRRRLLMQVIGWVEPVEPAAAERLYRALARSVERNNSHYLTHREDLDLVASAFERLLERAEGDEPKCIWARGHARLRLERVAFFIEKAREVSERDEMMEGVPGPDYFELATTLDDLKQRWSSEARVVARRLARMPAIEEPRSRDDWAVLQTQLPIATERCGWR